MKTMSLIAAAAVLVAAGPALAIETLTATFTKPDGGVTAYLYSGIVRVTVSGIGQSLAAEMNDAFYKYDPLPVEHNANYYQLAFDTTTLTAHDKYKDAAASIVGALPTYDPSHVYTFLLDTGTTTPSKLHFGVVDGLFSDNTGAYDITIAVPEPATWALMLGGFAVVGAAQRRRRRHVAA
jgi:hypothetical protein